MTQPLRIGLIGGGINSAIGRAHVAAISMDNAYNIGPCLFSQDEDINKASHNKYGIAWSEHPKDLAAWLDAHHDVLDLVAVLTPSTDHSDHLCQVIERGLPVVIEKPVVCSRAEVEKVRAVLADNSGIYARFVHNYSGYPMFRELVLRVENGSIGPVYHIRTNYQSDGYARDPEFVRPQVWRQTDPEVPMLLLDLGTHAHHLVHMIAGQSSGSLQARFHQMVNRFDVIDNAEIWEQRTDGVAVTHWMSKAHLGEKNGLSIEVYGRDGALVWRQMDPDHLILIGKDSSNTRIDRGAICTEAARLDRFKAGHPTGYVEAFANFYLDLADDLRAHLNGTQGSRWICPIEAGFSAVNYLACAATANSTGHKTEF